LTSSGRLYGELRTFFEQHVEDNIMTAEESLMTSGGQLYGELRTFLEQVEDNIITAEESLLAN
jgi:hypothetical protein